MYRVFIERRAEKDLKRFNNELYARVMRVLLSLKENPRPHGTKKLRDKGNEWRLRVGNWRITYEINDGEEAIRIFRVKHRGKGY